jgi:hypothetical protein
VTDDSQPLRISLNEPDVECVDSAGIDLLDNRAGQYAAAGSTLEVA